MLDIKRLDKVTNAAVLEKVEQRPLTITVQQRQMRWLGHTLRRDPVEPARIFALYEPASTHGRIPAGRPPEPYKEYVAKLFTSAHKDLTVKQIVEKAQNRNEWAKSVADIGRRN